MPLSIRGTGERRVKLRAQDRPAAASTVRVRFVDPAVLRSDEPLPLAHPLDLRDV